MTNLEELSYKTIFILEYDIQLTIKYKFNFIAQEEIYDAPTDASQSGTFLQKIEKKLISVGIRILSAAHSRIRNYQGGGIAKKCYIDRNRRRELWR